MTEQPMICENCQSEMRPLTLREWIGLWTGFACPGCHLAIPEVEVAEVEAVVDPAPRPKRKRKAEVIESEGNDGTVPRD